MRSNEKLKMNWGNWITRANILLLWLRKVTHICPFLHSPIIAESLYCDLECCSWTFCPWIRILMLCCYPCKHAVSYTFVHLCEQRSYNNHQSNSSKVHTLNLEFKQRFLQCFYQLLSLLGLLQSTICFIEANEIVSSHLL